MSRTSRRWVPTIDDLKRLPPPPSREPLSKLSPTERTETLIAFYRALASGISERLEQRHPSENWIRGEADSLLARFIEIARKEGLDYAYWSLQRTLVSRRWPRKPRPEPQGRTEALALLLRRNVLLGDIEREFRQNRLGRRHLRYRNPEGRTLDQKRIVTAFLGRILPILDDVGQLLFSSLSRQKDHLARRVTPERGKRALTPLEAEKWAGKLRTPRAVMEFVLADLYGLSTHQLRRRVTQAERVLCNH